MRIVIVATSGDSLLKFRSSLIKEWVNRGCEVYAISIEPTEVMQDAIMQLGAKYYQVTGSRTDTSIGSGIKMIKDYMKAFSQIKPDMCFLYMSKPIAFGGIAAILCKIKRIVVFQTGLEIAFYNNDLKSKLIQLVLKSLYRFVQLRCETVFFMCHEDQKRMLDWHLVNQNQVAYVDGSGVDMKKFLRQPLGNEPVVLMVARLVWSKGIREYIEAAKLVKKEYPQVRFMLVGGLDNNSESLSRLELDELVSSGIIEYKGYHKDVRPFLKECTIFVLPSYHEGKGTAILEAQATGRPIITTTAPGCSETVINGFNGYLVPSKNGKLLGEKIKYLIERPLLRQKMAENAYCFCKKTFSSDIICNAICQRLGIDSNENN